MTCIVAYKEGGEVHIGGDSAATDSNYCSDVRTDRKVFSTEDGRFLIGFTSSFRMGQILQYKLTVPEHKAGVSDHGFMCTTFVDAVRQLFTDNGVNKTENGVEECGTFIVIYNSQIFIIEEDFQVCQNSESYAAVGSGSTLALGAFHAMKNENMRAEEKVVRALKAATHHNCTVRQPYVLFFKNFATGESGEGLFK